MIICLQVLRLYLIIQGNVKLYFNFQILIHKLNIFKFNYRNQN